MESFKQNPEIPSVTSAESIAGEKISGTNVLSSYELMLEEDSFETVSEALGEVESLQLFRKEVSRLQFGSFSELVESASFISRQTVDIRKRSTQISLLAEKMQGRSQGMSPRVADLYNAVLAEVSGDVYDTHFEVVGKFLEDIKKSDNQRSDIEILFSGDTSWEEKLNRIDKRLVSVLNGLRALDKRDGKDMDDDIRKWRATELKNSSTTAPERRNESKPGVDPMERLREGEEAKAIWSINPAWGGLYKERSFSAWDSTRNVWFESENEYVDVESVELSGNTDHTKGPIDITMNTRATAGSWVSVPIPYTHGFHSLEVVGHECIVKQDQNGDVVFRFNGDRDADVKVVLAAYLYKKFKSDTANVRIPVIPSEFSDETNNKLEEIKSKKRGNIARASALSSYVRSRVRYLAPKDREESEQYNLAYNNHPKGFAGAVDEIREADCDVANTYFAALCSKLGIPVRHIVGHSVSGKDDDGLSSINSGTGHGWSEVWNEIKKEWVRIDATPGGDPNLSGDKQSAEFVPGDYGMQEAVVPSDVELEKLRKELAEHKEKLSYTKEERELAESAGVELREARKIVNEINKAERTRLPNGELIVDALTKLFNMIVESRKSTTLTHSGPVRRREGGESIQDIVRHKIGVTAGEFDPLSRKRSIEEEKKEELFGGLDLYLIGDKSGSMGNTVDGESLWEIQRRAAYLIFSSLYRFERNLERAGLQEENALSVRTECVSFRGSNPGEIDLDKQLSSQFTSSDKVKMWHSLTDAPGSNGDPQALAYVYEQIKEEIEADRAKPEDKNRLRIIIACSDGGYVGNDALKMRMIAQKIYELDPNIVLVGMGLTDTAAEVPIVMNNLPYSKGQVVRDINDLPAVVAKYIVLEALKLFPEKTREDILPVIKGLIDRFSQV